jgi:hypothetical protein
LEIEGRDVAIGLVAASSVMFLVAVWPAIKDPELREPVAYHPARDQNDFEALVTSWILFGSMGFVMNLWADLMFGPKTVKEMLTE